MNPCKYSWLTNVAWIVAKPDNAFLTVFSLSARIRLSEVQTRGTKLLMCSQSWCMMLVIIQTRLYVFLTNAFVIEVPTILFSFVLFLIFSSGFGACYFFHFLSVFLSSFVSFLLFLGCAVSAASVFPLLVFQSSSPCLLIWTQCLALIKHTASQLLFKFQTGKVSLCSCDIIKSNVRLQKVQIIFFISTAEQQTICKIQTDVQTQKQTVWSH